MLKTFVLGALAALGLVGCGGAVHHHRGTFGGVIRLETAADLVSAEVLMAEHCEGRFEILHGAEAVIDDGGALPPGGERVHYACARARSASRR